MSQAALEKGRKYLEDNGQRSGIVTTVSGLQYEVVQAGTGKSPKATDTVLVHYEGTLIDGTVFDSSYRRNEPIDFPLNQVIKGWTEGVQLMQEGAKYRFYLPSELAYGVRGAGPDIGPNEALIFVVELLKVM
jgi:FKBP-type peptidyl-prolyl cis-trans isomerase FkpA